MADSRIVVTHVIVLAVNAAFVSNGVAKSGVVAIAVLVWLLVIVIVRVPPLSPSLYAAAAAAAAPPPPPRSPAPAPPPPFLVVIVASLIQNVVSSVFMQERQKTCLQLLGLRSGM